MATTRVLRRFPWNLAIGTDVCHVVRISRILQSSRGTRFVQRILNTDERGHPKIQCLFQGQSQHHLSFRNANPPDDPSLSKNIQLAANFIAGRFAAKEAVIKAHPDRALTWHDITIKSQTAAIPGRNGAPSAIIRGENEDQEALLSISHDGKYATAVCLGAGEPR